MKRPGARLAVAAAVALVAAAFHATYAFDGIALFDEGILIDGAWRVAHGAVPGVDGWMPYGPAGYWTVAPFLSWFGESVATVRGVLVGMQALADGALCWLLLGTATLPGALLATALLVVAHGSLHKSAIVVAALLALFAARALAPGADDSRADDTRGSRSRAGDAAPGVRGAFGAGLLAAAAFLFRHDVGGFAGAACAIGLLIEPRAAWRARVVRVAALCAGFAALLLPVVIALLAAGLDLGAWWAHEWQRIAVQERIAIDLADPRVAGEWRGGRIALLAALVGSPVLLAAWAAGAWWRLRRGAPVAGDRTRIVAALFGLLLLNQARLIPSTNHLFQALAPIAWAAGDLLARRGRGLVPHAALAALLAGLVVWAANGKSGPYSGTFRQRIDGAVPLALATGGVRLRPDFALTLEQVVAAIQRRVGVDEALATSPGSPLLGFLAQRRLVLPAEPSYWYHDPHFQREAIAALERARPPLLVSDRSEPANFRFEEAAPLVAAWLAQRYRAVEQIGPFTVHERVR